MSLDELIDNDVFRPLSAILIAEPFNPELMLERVQKFRSAKRDPNAGFILEAYVQLCVSDLIARGVLSPTRLGAGNESGGIMVEEVNEFGNVIFSDSESRKAVSEVDGLFEYSYGSLVIPIIFEVSYRRDNFKAFTKTSVVNRFYENPSYRCTVSRQPDMMTGRFGLLPPSVRSRRIKIPYT